MAFAYRVVRSFGDIERFDCVPIEETYRGKARGNQFLITRKNGFSEIFTTKKRHDEHWVGILLDFKKKDSTVTIGQF